MRAAIDAGVAELGGLDVVVANAGVMVAGAWHEMTEEIWDQILDTNLKGVWNTASLTAPHLIERGGGSMILVSSSAGLKGQPFLSAYVASKHGVVGLMRAYAVELAQHSIRVNSLHPAGVDTPMGTADRSRTFTPLIESNPELGPLLKNLLPVEITDPDDQSHAVVYLASDESRYVTASTFTVDAGNTQL
jgi:NAD(P)-dependent dehydrogenase (short-subunit alcohol dehydrogenase family)